MAKHMRKRKKKAPVVVLIVLVLLILIGALVVFVMPGVLFRINEDKVDEQPNIHEPTVSVPEQEESESSEEVSTVEEEESSEESEPIDALEFPMKTEDGSLLIDKVFQYSGINPDCDNQEGTDVAAIAVTNLSGTYLQEANVEVTSNSGDAIKFVVTDLPAGKSLIAFAVDNISVNNDSFYTDIQFETVFDPQASLNEEKITAAVEGTKITLQNNTDAEIETIDVYCHSTLGDQLFGGITYKYSVSNLPANGTAELEAADCFLGLTEVVRISVN